jgi:predicted O-methyltransferase YrrM
MTKLLRAATRRVNNIGWRDTAEVGLSRLLWVVAGSALRNTSRPSLHDLSAASRRVYLDAGELFRQEWPGSGVLWEQELSLDFQAVLKTLKAELDRSPLRYPDEYGIEGGTAQLIYSLVRSQRPSTIVETGVANGVSSFIMLAALEHNGAGTLHSFDVSHDVGSLVARRDTSRWVLHVLNRQNAGSEFRRTIGSLPPIDLFFHDSDHSYGWQMLEFSVVSDRLASPSVFASDDIDASHAFMDFARSASMPFVALVDQRKVLGVAQR